MKSSRYGTYIFFGLLLGDLAILFSQIPFADAQGMREVMGTAAQTLHSDTVHVGDSPFTSINFGRWAIIAVIASFIAWRYGLRRTSVALAALAGICCILKLPLLALIGVPIVMLIAKMRTNDESTLARELRKGTKSRDRILKEYINKAAVMDNDKVSNTKESIGAEQLKYSRIPKIGRPF
jgi:hypothetical protein